jgi:hypothetical protein
MLISGASISENRDDKENETFLIKPEGRRVEIAERGKDEWDCRCTGAALFEITSCQVVEL